MLTLITDLTVTDCSSCALGFTGKEGGRERRKEGGRREGRWKKREEVRGGEGGREGGERGREEEERGREGGKESWVKKY